MLKLKNMWETLDSKAIENEEDKVPEKLIAKIENILKETDMAVDVASDQVKEGMINSSVYDCITLTNRDHGNRYFKFAIVYSADKKKALFMAYGESKNLKKLERRSRAKDNVKSGASGLFSSGGSSVQKGLAVNNVVSSAVGSIMSLGGSKKKQDLENQYYDKIHILLQEVI